ncbi:STAS domain-containing protein [Streptomyces sp. NPDC048383]|uniref:STAS domain-containing protein n=1 Tax=Streptomyces sp. NPDC048383 TaxID=3155386 RepID=UPI0034355D5C
MAQLVQVLPDEDGVRVIVCRGEFDQDTLGPLKEAGTAAANDPGVRRIILDVTAVTFADSSMLNLMLLLLRTGRLVLAGPLPDRLGRLLDITEARTLFTTTDSIQEARAL